MIELKDLKVCAGSFFIQDVNMSVGSGQCASLMGMSGSGKTTVMEAICGLKNVISGQIMVDDEDVTYAAPAARNVGFVPQDNVLFATMTVREQIAYGPKVRRWAAKNREKRVEEVASELGIAKLLDRKPGFLSGGEAKRVAIARAIAPKPKVLCLDESFTGLDDKTHSEVMQVVKQAIEHEQMTTLFITHHQKEAEFLADVHFSIEDGRVRDA